MKYISNVQEDDLTISIKSGKAKGRRLQQWVANKISLLLDIPAEKDGEIESRSMGQSGVDVILRGEAKKLFPFSVECKSVEKWAIHSWIKQAKTNQMKDTNWLLICKRNHEKPIIVLDADVFFDILKEKLDEDNSGRE